MRFLPARAGKKSASAQADNPIRSDRIARVSRWVVRFFSERPSFSSAISLIYGALESKTNRSDASPLSGRRAQRFINGFMQRCCFVDRRKNRKHREFSPARIKQNRASDRSLKIGLALPRSTLVTPQSEVSFAAACRAFGSTIRIDIYILYILPEMKPGSSERSDAEARVVIITFQDFRNERSRIFSFSSKVSLRIAICHSP